MGGRLTKRSWSDNGAALREVADLVSVAIGNDLNGIFKPVLALALALTISASPAKADTTRTDYPAKLFAPAPTSIWLDPAAKPKAVAIAMHGLVMHGGTYDTLARQLVKQGFVVAAPDMRGYGHWLSQKDNGQNKADDSKDGFEISYDDSYADLAALAKKLKGQYPDLPLFLIGESLGAAMSLRLAATEPDVVDGLVLSSPAIKRQTFLGPVVAKSPNLLKPGDRSTSLHTLESLLQKIPKLSKACSKILSCAKNFPLVTFGIRCRCSRPRLPTPKMYQARCLS